MRCTVLYLILSISFLTVSCNKASPEKKRQISNAVSCQTDQECFEFAESLFLKNEDLYKSGLEWSLLSNSDSVINFHDYSELGEAATIFVMDHHYVNEAKEYLIRLGSDDGFQLFVNGKKVASRIIGRSVKPDSDWIKINLKKGVNVIIFQINQGDGGWGLYYKIENRSISKPLFSEHLHEIYRDLPDATIIQSEIDSLLLNIDPRSNLDIFHDVRFKWVNPFDGKIIWDSLLSANIIPNKLKIPDSNGYPLLFDYEVIDKNRVVYKETIPIFTESSIEKILRDSEDYKLHQLWTEGIKLLFAKELDLPIPKQYSTRLKTEFLWDILNETRILNYDISGPRTEIFNNKLAKRYVPNPQKKEPEMVLGLHVDFSDTVFSYLMSYPGGSHALMSEWNSYAQYYGIELFFPFIVEAEPELTTQKILTEFELQEPDSFNVIAWSKSTVTLFDALEYKSFLIQKAGIISPWVLDAPTQRFLITRNIAKNNSQINWHWWRGEEDSDVPGSIVLDWVEEFEKQKMQIHYSEIPYSSHWTYWISPEKKFYQEFIN